ncbi:hypothetical protein GNZ11_23180 [Paraburkholderia xenovorans]|nr:hypothetical protein [Paraburkholderia xenovorans]
MQCIIEPDDRLYTVDWIAHGKAIGACALRTGPWNPKAEEPVTAEPVVLNDQAAFKRW